MEHREEEIIINKLILLKNSTPRIYVKSYSSDNVSKDSVQIKYVKDSPQLKSVKRLSSCHVCQTIIIK